MESTTAIRRSQTSRQCLCGGKVVRESKKHRGHWLTRFVCDGCGCSTLWLVAGKNGEETQELVYLWGLAQDKKAEAMAEAGLASDIDFLEEADLQQRLARESTDRLIADLRRANGREEAR